MSRLIGVSAHRLVGIAIFMDFARKMGDFEAALQERLAQGKWVLASRAKLIYLAAWLLGDSSLSCLATWRLIA